MTQVSRPQPIAPSPDPQAAPPGQAPIPHHILCAGRSGVAFARLSAATLWAGCPAPLRPDLRIFIHLDAMPQREACEIAEWFSDAPASRVTFGLFGIRNPRKAINWHQRMISRVAELFRSERRIAFVDADLFVADPAWWGVATAPPSSDVPPLYAQTLGMRKERRLRIGDRVFEAMKTVLFTLDPTLHLAINTQILNSDTEAARRLALEFPGSALEVGKFVDTMVVPSLRAQALGYRVEDLSGRIEACHVGGFSHISAKKLLKGQSTVARESWLRRLRLFERVIETLTARGWDRFLDPHHRSAAARMREVVEADPAMREAVRSLKPSPDEIAFDRLPLTPSDAPMNPPR